MELQRVKIATTSNDLKAKLVLFAISSRIFIIVLSWISNTVIPDHDAGVYIFPQPTVNRTLADHVIEDVLGGLPRWDAQYFLHIAHFGYTYENTLAFFPLFPFFTRVLARVLGVIFNNILNSLSLALLSALIVNVYFFVNASLKLFELSRKILKDDSLAYKSALFFCINPASIFFTAPYSESCFAFFTFSGMLFCVDNNNDLLATFSLGLSSCARSNGVLNFGYICHKVLKNVITNLETLRSMFRFSSFYFVLIQLWKLCIYASVFFTPFLLFQVYSYITFCIDALDMPDFVKEYGQANSFVMPSSEPRPWCTYNIPFSYSYVQEHYWDVGFLKYYHLKQLPNFLLALPVIFIVINDSYRFMLENNRLLLTLGFTNAENVVFQKRVFKSEFFVFVVHAVFLTVFCTLFVHIQVTTRMIASSCPVFYWFVSLRYKTETHNTETVISSRLKNLSSNKYSLVETQQNMNSVWRNVILTSKPGNTWSYFVKTYFCSYLILGTILFSNFLPWT